jgi:hypothetical protein
MSVRANEEAEKNLRNIMRPVTKSPIVEPLTSRGPDDMGIMQQAAIQRQGRPFRLPQWASKVLIEDRERQE